MENIKSKDSIKIEEGLLSLDFSKGIHLDTKGHIKRNEGVINDCYVCVRPGNKQNVPKVYTEEQEGRIIVNNYGHGGIGWSTNWGSVINSIKLVQELQTKENRNLVKDCKIAIIGAGCNGCSTALMLVEKGVDPKNISIFCERMDDLTSHRSGAILSTASVMEEINSNLQKVYDDINIDSYVTWDKILNGEIFPKLKEGIKRVKAYFGAEKEWGTIETDSGLDTLVDKGLIPKPELVYVKFKNRLNLMRKYQSFYFNTFKLMRAYYDIILNDFKIKISIGKLSSFKEIDPQFNIIFNCSALGNMKDFNKDKDIYPIGGHIVTLKHQNINQFDYVMYSHYIHKEDIGKYNFQNAPLFYLMLKTDDKNYSGLLGGSLCENYEGGNIELDEEEYKRVLKRTLEIFGENNMIEKPNNKKIISKISLPTKAKF